MTMVVTDEVPVIFWGDVSVRTPNSSAITVASNFLLINEVTLAHYSIFLVDFWQSSLA
jgi:hypothetical protein